MLKTFMLGMVSGVLTLSSAGAQPRQAHKDIVETAVSAGSFTTVKPERYRSGRSSTLGKRFRQVQLSNTEPPPSAFGSRFYSRNVCL
jgi:hypothetical protein